MSRPIWKGNITFGLVSIPVILYSAEKKSEIRFKLVDSRDKSPIRYVRVNEHTGEEVAWEDIAKGYEYNDHGLVLIKEDELKSIAGENTKSIPIENFVEQDSLDYMDFERPYYLLPDKKGEKGYVILRETLRATKKVGIAKVIIHTRQYLAALMPYENALTLNLLRYHSEIRDPEEFNLPTNNLKIYKITPREMEIAKELVASMTMKWDPEAYQDEYQQALEKWISQKMHHEKPHAKMRAARTGKSNVVNFADLLKKSIKKGKANTVTKKKPIKHKKIRAK